MCNDRGDMALSCVMTLWTLTKCKRCRHKTYYKSRVTTQGNLMDLRHPPNTLGNVRHVVKYCGSILGYGYGIKCHVIGNILANTLRVSLGTIGNLKACTWDDAC
jgi:hypothetical protein